MLIQTCMYHIIHFIYVTQFTVNCFTFAKTFLIFTTFIFYYLSLLFTRQKGTIKLWENKERK